jgi:hypothetical protein
METVTVNHYDVELRKDEWHKIPDLRVFRDRGVYLSSFSLSLDVGDLKPTIEIGLWGASELLTTTKSWGAGTHNLELSNYFAIYGEFAPVEFGLRADCDLKTSLTASAQVAKFFNEPKEKLEIFVCVDDYGIEQCFNLGVEYLGKSLDSAYLELHNNRGEAVKVNRSRFKTKDEMSQMQMPIQ